MTSKIDRSVRTLVGLRRIRASQLTLAAAYDGRRGRNPAALDTIQKEVDLATIEVATSIIEDIKEDSDDSE